jgi:polysaccharide biosynthesis protein PslG
MLAGLVAIAILSALLLWLSVREALPALLFQWTGEEQPFSQLKALTDLTADLLRPPINTADQVPVTHTGVNPFGINIFLEQEVEEAKRERTVAMIADAGFHWLRQEFPWEDIEIHGKGDFEDRRHEPARSAWDKYDSIVALAEKYHLELIVRLSNPPEWTRARGIAAGTFAPPDDYNDFGDFVAAVVARYKDRVHYYQIWNEPNIYPEWGEAPVNPRQYVTLLKVAYTRAKAVDPDVVIISGALASNIELDYRNLNDFSFLQQMYDAGARPYFDILAMQGYGLWSGPTDHRMQPRVINFSRPRFVRDLMVQNGDAAKPIWISEMNWNAVPDDVADKRFGQVTEAQQARYAPLAYQRAQEEWPWLGVINFWYFKRASDQWKLEQKPEYYFRMVEPDFTPLPVYDAMKAYTAQPPVVYPGFHQEDHWALQYTGAWESVADTRAVLGHLMRSNDPQATLSFTFTGTALMLVAPQGPGLGKMQIEIDGNRKEVNLGGPAAAAHHFVIARRFSSYGPHQVTIRPAPGQDNAAIAIDGLIVERRALWLQPVLLVGITLFFGIALVGQAMRIGRSSRRLAERIPPVKP